MIGQDHIRRLTHVLSGGRVAAVTDADLDRAQTVADGLPGAAVHKTGQDLIEDSDVDAVVVASWGRPTRSSCWPASPRASRCSARSGWPPLGRRASGSW